MKFIKSGIYPKNNIFDAPAVLFRKKFFVENSKNAKLKFCALGYGYIYINGNLISDDLFSSPVSNYNKTLWMKEYDISHLLKDGKNIICAELGNGFFNESFDSVWKHNEAEWRDEPKIWLSIEIKKNLILETDESWKVKLDKATYFNQLRSGEYFDSRFFDRQWIEYSYFENDWSYALIDLNPPKGIVRECICPSIKEFESFLPTKVFANKCGFVYDLGQNISGYTEIEIQEKSGTKICLNFAEEIDLNNELVLNNLGEFYPSVPFQQDIFICNGQKQKWKPKFTYHGFRYVQVSGIRKSNDIKIVGIFVHQDVKKLSNFKCSNDFLNKLYNASIFSLYSNMQDQLTDCPTREKLGWLNDAQVSLETLLINFDSKDFFKKWYIDIIDTMKSNGSISCIAPTPNWGYETGSVTDSAIMLIPYILYKIKGDKSLLLDNLSDIEKYYGFFLSQNYRSKIGDWNGKCSMSTPKEFIELCYHFIYLKILITANHLSNKLDISKKYSQDIEKVIQTITNKYISNKQCLIDSQTAISMLITLNIANHNELGVQLVSNIEANNFHHTCGMIGLPFLYYALSKINRQDLIYKIISNPTAPSFKAMLDDGATSLYESFFQTKNISKNHHLYSNVTGFLLRDVLGIKYFYNNKTISVNPFFLDEIENAEGFIEIDTAKIFVSWKRDGSAIDITINVIGNIEVLFNGKILKQGEYREKLWAKQEN